MAAARVSVRVSIAWSGDTPYEDTDTLVLTIHDYSLDLRVFVTGNQKGQIDWSTVAKVSEIEGSTSGKFLPNHICAVLNELRKTHSQLESPH